MSFSEKVQAEALVACGRCCCICHKFCGTKIALHHIKQKAYGGDDSFDNCIPLCLDCHEDMGKADPHHVTGKHYTEKELRMHRDKWYKENGYLAEKQDCDTHPAFLEVKKQLSIDEIKILSYMKSNTIIPTISIRLPIGTSGYGKVLDNFTYVPEIVGCKNTENIEIHFDNMIRLGVLKKHYSGLTFSEKECEKLRKHPVVQAHYARALETLSRVKQFTKMDEVFGFYMLTDFGKEFCKACINDKW